MSKSFPQPSDPTQLLTLPLKHHSYTAKRGDVRISATPAPDLGRIVTMQEKSLGSTPVKRFRIAACALALASLFLLSAGSPARAHSFLTESTPAAKEHVSPPVKQIRLLFGGGVEIKYSKITLELDTGETDEGKEGKIVAEGGRGGDVKEMFLDLPPDLAPGKYKVRYRVLSTDGHVVQGRYEFFIDKP